MTTNWPKTEPQLRDHKSDDLSITLPCHAEHKTNLDTFKKSQSRPKLKIQFKKNPKNANRTHTESQHAGSYWHTLQKDSSSEF